MKELSNINIENTKSVIVAHRLGEQPYISTPHLHSSLEIYYNIKGCRSFLVNNKFNRCEPNDMFLVPCMQIHKALLNNKDSYERCIISISSEIINKINEMPNITQRPFERLFSYGMTDSYKTHLNESEHIEFIELVHSYNSCENDDVDKFIILLRILQFIRKKYQNDAIEKESFLPETVADEILDYIEQNFKNKISIAQISQIINISEAQLYRIFKKETGMTIKEYLTLRRISEAKKFLYLGFSVKEACFKSGFSDYQNFVRSFKRIEGYSPGQMEELNSPI